MSSNALTDDQPVESIKKFKFYTKNEKDEIEISIPEVSVSIGCIGKNRCNKYGAAIDAFVQRMRKTGSKTS